jgi:predicted ArsR family transcriptional regulator
MKEWRKRTLYKAEEVFKFLQEQGGEFIVSEIASALNEKEGYVRKLLQILEKRGLVKKRFFGQFYWSVADERENKESSEVRATAG